MWPVGQRSVLQSHSSGLLVALKFAGLGLLCIVDEDMMHNAKINKSIGHFPKAERSCTLFRSGWSPNLDILTAHHPRFPLRRGRLA